MGIFYRRLTWLMILLAPLALGIEACKKSTPQAPRTAPSATGTESTLTGGTEDAIGNSSLEPDDYGHVAADIQNTFGNYTQDRQGSTTNNFVQTADYAAGNMADTPDGNLDGAIADPGYKDLTAETDQSLAAQQEEENTGNLRGSGGGGGGKKDKEDEEQKKVMRAMGAPLLMIGAIGAGVAGYFWIKYAKMEIDAKKIEIDEATEAYANRRQTIATTNADLEERGKALMAFDPDGKMGFGDVRGEGTATKKGVFIEVENVELKAGGTVKIRFESDGGEPKAYRVEPDVGRGAPITADDLLEGKDGKTKYSAELKRFTADVGTLKTMPIDGLKIEDGKFTAFPTRPKYQLDAFVSEQRASHLTFSLLEADPNAQRFFFLSGELRPQTDIIDADEKLKYDETLKKMQAFLGVDEAVTHKINNKLSKQGLGFAPDATLEVDGKKTTPAGLMTSQRNQLAAASMAFEKKVTAANTDLGNNRVSKFFDTNFKNPSSIKRSVISLGNTPGGRLKTATAAGLAAAVIGAGLLSAGVGTGSGLAAGTLDNSEVQKANKLQESLGLCQQRIERMHSCDCNFNPAMNGCQVCGEFPQAVREVKCLQPLFKRCMAQKGYFKPKGNSCGGGY